MNFDDAVVRLQIALAQPLPGAVAHALMSPRPRRTWPDDKSALQVRHAAGLLLLYPGGSGNAHIVLTVRADGLGRHSGQVSLPGGVAEPGETFAQAALREAEEEIALTAETADLRILGALSPIDIPVSGFRLHPIVAATKMRPRLTPADGEVARILHVDVDDLCDASRRTWLTVVREGRDVSAPAFAIEGANVWGATAMVLAEFLAALGCTLEVGEP
jgi:8-oxo-dGTP pyrophosphatase MutT (NUDIX family)